MGPTTIPESELQPVPEEFTHGTWHTSPALRIVYFREAAVKVRAGKLAAAKIISFTKITLSNTKKVTLLRASVQTPVGVSCP